MAHSDDAARAMLNWLRRNARAERNPSKRNTLLEAHNAALKIIKEHERMKVEEEA
jgi:hypothetical protein